MSDNWCLVAITETGERIAFDLCFAPNCGRHLSLCVCEEGPTPPHLGETSGIARIEEIAAAPAA